MTAWEPRRRFGFTWPEVQLTFDLSRQGSVSVVKLTCTYQGEAGSETQIEELVGWTMHLMNLFAWRMHNFYTTMSKQFYISTNYCDLLGVRSNKPYYNIIIIHHYTFSI